MKIEYKRLGLAISIAAAAFEGKFDRGGQPYILHCLWVMNKVRHLGEDYMIAAVCHDLVEDTNITIADLHVFCFGPEVVAAIDCLTHKDTDTYQSYIRKISQNPIAKEIKLRDLEHNSKITRLKGLREKDFARLEKYHAAYLFLKEN